MNIMLILNNLLQVDPNQEVTGNLRFTTENLGTALSYMVRGMVGIFVALFVIYLASIGLQKLFPAKED